MEEKFDFKKFEKVANKSRYEKRLSQLSTGNKETDHIDKAVQESIKNIKSKSNSFIIYGEPQCGKTELMIALAARLLDESHKMIIVLVTDNVSLLTQNLNRFRISGIEPSPKNFDEILDDNISLGDSNWIIFSKKNSSNLKKLIEKLKGFNSKVIIDDEADYATPNSKVNKPEEKSKINELTSELIGKDGIYIGVTATPGRLDLNNTHNNQNQKWIHFKAHSKYTGQEIFFPLEAEDLDYKLIFTDETKEDWLIDALFSYMVNVAHLNLKINSKGEQNYSFLVHTSGKTADHSRDYQQIVKTLSILSDRSNNEREDYYKKIWSIAKKRYPGEEDEIVSYIVENNQRSNVVVMNSTRDFNKNGNSVTDPSTLFTIVVGGNIVSRGVTFNNLLSMFFTRSVKGKFHQDTYIQRARMFGSRGDYLKYFELFIPEDLYFTWHDCFVLHRLSLESIHSNNGPPVWLYNDKVAVTSSSSVDHSSVSTEGGEIRFELFDYDKNKISEILKKDITNIEKIKEISQLVGNNALPQFLISYITKNSSSEKENIKIYNPMTPKWKDVNLDNLTRGRGFISTSSKDFKDYNHHILIIFNDSKKARICYKPSSSKMGFLKNIKWI